MRIVGVLLRLGRPATRDLLHVSTLPQPLAQFYPTIDEHDPTNTSLYRLLFNTLNSVAGVHTEAGLAFAIDANQTRFVASRRMSISLERTIGNPIFTGIVLRTRAREVAAHLREDGRIVFASCKLPRRRIDDVPLLRGAAEAADGVLRNGGPAEWASEAAAMEVEAPSSVGEPPPSLMGGALLSVSPRAASLCTTCCGRC